MAESSPNSSLRRVWKGFRSTVTLRQGSVSDDVDFDHGDPNALKLVSITAFYFWVKLIITIGRFFHRGKSWDSPYRESLA
jgi:hypothetical protein